MEQNPSDYEYDALITSAEEAILDGDYSHAADRLQHASQNGVGGTYQQRLHLQQAGFMKRLAGRSATSIDEEIKAVETSTAELFALDTMMARVFFDYAKWLRQLYDQVPETLQPHVFDEASGALAASTYLLTDSEPELAEEARLFNVGFLEYVTAK